MCQPNSAIKHQPDDILSPDEVLEIMPPSITKGWLHSHWSKLGGRSFGNRKLITYGVLIATLEGRDEKEDEVVHQGQGADSREKTYLYPKHFNMLQRYWDTEEEALLALKLLEQLVQERYSTVQSSIPTDLLTLSTMWLKSYEGQVKGEDTIPKKIRFCKDILKLWGNINITDIRVFMAQEYLQDRANRFSNNNFNAYRKEGVAFFNWLLDQELIPAKTKNVFDKVKKAEHDSKDVQPAPINDVLKVWSVASQSQKDLIDTLILTGARKNEILTMTWSDIDFDSCTYKLHTNKSGGKGRKTTLHSISNKLMEILLRRAANRHPAVNYVFWHQYYSHTAKMIIEGRYQSLNKFTQRLCKKAQVNHFTLHQLRHLAASILKQEGATIAELQRFLRHDEQKTTEIYAGHLDNSTQVQNETLDKFWSEKLDEAVNG